MAETPKILQVSLGAFSCRLEGFDDPVETLKTVVDYLSAKAAEEPNLIAGTGVREGSPLEELARAIGAELPNESETGPGSDLGGDVGVSPPDASEPDAPSLEADEAPATAQQPVKPSEVASQHEPEWQTSGALPASGRDKLLAGPDGDETAMSRILSRADDQMADPESTRRRDAIASLKAAVAATKADPDLEASVGGSASRREAFHEDLRESVESSDDRPPGSPLRLVAAQRVDLSVEGTPPDPTWAGDASDSFVDFAREMGAQTLPDLMEAAAAWLAFVRQDEDFARSQLLEMAGDALPEQPTREDGLSAFGVLLRQGRILPVANGRYRVSTESRFNPGRLAV